MTTQDELDLTRRSYAAARTISALYDGGSHTQLSRPWDDLLAGSPTSSKSSRAIDQVVVVRGMQTIGDVVFLTDYLGNMYVCASGVTAYTARYLVYGWASQSTMLRADGLNSNSYQDATSRTIPSILYLLPATRRVYLYGHSGGGVYVECLARVLATAIPNPVAELVTYGAPKPGLVGATTQGITTTRVRWMNAYDAVPSLPLASGDSSVSYAIDLVSNDYTPSLIVQGTGGRLLLSNGVWAAADTSTGAIDPGRVGVCAWLIGLDRSRGFPHSMDSYLTYIGRLLTRLEDNLSGQVPMYDHVPLESVISIPPRTQPPGGPNPNPGVLTIAGTVATTPGGQTFPVSVSRSTDMANQARIDPSLRLVWQRTGNVYVVRWDDVVLFTCPTGSSAKSIATSWNRSLRLLGKTTNIIPASVTSYLQMLFSAAAAGNGVKPPWNVT